MRNARWMVRWSKLRGPGVGILLATGGALGWTLSIADSAGAQTTPPAAPPPPSTQPPPGASPPPYMFQEQLTPEQRLPAPPPPPAAPPPASTTAPSGPLPALPSQAPVYGPAAQPPPPPPGYGVPPYYIYEPLPPPPPRHRAPANSLWLGVRGGVLIPTGSIYDDITTVDSVDSLNRRTQTTVQASSPWRYVATTGPSAELDLGGRFSHRYVLYGLWEHAWLGMGNDASTRNEFGGEKSAKTDMVGLGIRWSSNPNDVGVLVDAALGYRWFNASWNDGTHIDLRGFGEFRLGIGADIRLSNSLSVSPLFSLSGGSFDDRTLSGPGGSQSLGLYTASHGTVAFTVGAHYDIVP